MHKATFADPCVIIERPCSKQGEQPQQSCPQDTAGKGGNRINLALKSRRSCLSKRHCLNSILWKLNIEVIRSQ